MVAFELASTVSDFFFHLIKLIHESSDLVTQRLHVTTGVLELLLVVLYFFDTLHDTLFQSALNLLLDIFHVCRVLFHLILVDLFILFEAVDGFVNVSSESVVLFNLEDALFFLSIQIFIDLSHLGGALIGQLLSK